MQYTSYILQISSNTDLHISSPCWQSIWKIRNELLSYWEYKEKNWICRVQVGPGFTPKPFTIVSTTFMFTLGSWRTTKESSKDPLHHVVTTPQYVTITGKMQNYAKLPTHCVESNPVCLHFLFLCGSFASAMLPPNHGLQACWSIPAWWWSFDSFDMVCLIIQILDRSVCNYFSQIPYLWTTSYI